VPVGTLEPSLGDLERSCSISKVMTGRNRTDIVLHCVPSTCDYIFCNNFNNKCPITIIFGISKSMRHRKMVSLPTSPI